MKNRTYLVSIYLLALLACTTNQVMNNNKIVKDYSNLDDLWQKIDSLEGKGMEKSALDLVHKAHDLAQEQEADAYALKAILVREKLQYRLGDTGNEPILPQIELALSEIQDAAQKAILSSMTGELMAQSVQQYAMESPTSDVARILNKADSLYDQSLDVQGDLALEDFTLIVTPKEYDSTTFRSVYDLLLYRAINHYRKDVREDLRLLSTIDRPAKVLNLYQRWKDNHRDEPVAQTVIALWQLDYLRQAGPEAADVRDLEYVQGLENLAKGTTSEEAQYHISLARAKYLSGMSREANSTAKAEAVAICEQMLKNELTEDLRARFSYLNATLTQANLTFETEGVVLPQESFLTKLSFQNISEVALQIYRVDPDVWINQNLNHYEEVDSQLSSQEVVHTVEIALPKTTDYHRHTSEYIAPKLPLGYYVLAVNGSSLHCYRLIAVSQLAFTTREYKGKSQFWVHDRKTGDHAQGVQGDWYSSSYQRRKVTLKKVAQTRSELDGGLPAPDRSQESLRLRLSLGEDVLWSDQQFHQYEWNQSPVSHQQIRFYTDRSIYRPGQQLDFKGIITSNRTGEYPKIIAGKKLVIKLLDGNRQEIDELNLESNEFGSVAGSFRLPSEGLLGQVFLSTEIGQQNVRCEEYRRPTFEAEINFPQPQIKLGDKVDVVGLVKSYAGFFVADAQVKYQVVRNPYFYGWRSFPVNQAGVTIAFGGVKSDADGRFDFTFDAIGPKISHGRQRSSYRVLIDVTDINGETQHFEEAIILSAKSFRTQIDLSPRIALDKLLEGIKVGAINHQGKRVDAEGKLFIYREISSLPWQRQRYWAEPELQAYTNQEFGLQLPLDAYQSAVDSLQQKELVLEIPVSASDSLVSLPPEFRSGRYEFILQLEAQGEKDEMKQIVEVVQPGSGYIPVSSLLWMTDEHMTTDVGERLRFWLGSPVPLQVRLEIETKDGFESEQWISLDGWKQIEIPIRSEHQGGIFLTVYGIHENRYASEHRQISVPWQQSKLDIVIGSYLDRTRPGSNQEVVLQVNDRNGQGKSAEVAMTIYDAALDAILPHRWSTSFGRSNDRQAGYRASQFQSRVVWPQAARSGRGVAAPRYRSMPNFDWFGISYWGVVHPPPMGVRMARMTGVRKESMSSGAEMAEAVSIDEDQQNLQDERLSNEEMSAETVRDDLSENLVWLAAEQTDQEGNLTLKFEMNDALTTWKTLLLAHDKDLGTAYHEFEFVSQKEIILVPNAPRFLRASDQIYFSTKVVNTTSEEVNASVTLAFDQAEEDAVIPSFPAEAQWIKLAPGESRKMSWNIDLKDTQPGTLTYLIKANSATYFDAVKDDFPVLPRRKLMTESLPFFVEAGQSQEVFFQRMIEADSLMAHHRITIDISSNPLWYAVQALPYLTFPERPCTEDLASVVYANEMAGHLFALHPGLAQDLDSWLAKDPTGRLFQNKGLLLDELSNTPWLSTATEEQKHLASLHLLLDEQSRKSEVTKAQRKLISLQLSGGALPWIAGGRPNRFITQQVLGTLANLADAGAIDLQQTPWQNFVQRALTYMDEELQADHRKIGRQVARKTAKWEDDHIGPIHAHALFIMTQLAQVGFEVPISKAYTYFDQQAEQYWYEKKIYVQAMLAYRALLEDRKVDAWLTSLHERSIETKDRGIYWKKNAGYDWHELPIEQHALLTRLFFKAWPEKRQLHSQLQRWLLLHKQTNHWPTSMATTAAVQALLLDDRLGHAQPARLVLGDQEINQSTSSRGGMYFRKSYKGDGLNEALKILTVENPNSWVVYGAIHWEYYADVDQVDEGVEQARLAIERTFFKKLENEFVEVGEDEIIVGDRILIRFAISSDRPIDFVQILDHRAAAFEPVEQLSAHHYKTGSSYYLSSGDVRTDFYIEHLDRGRHTFEYQAWAAQEGNMVGGLAEIQSVYAPEFTAHSKGIRMVIK